MKKDGTKLIIEKYKSNFNHREDHYFKTDGKHEEYLFGVNPKIVPKKIVKKILRSIRINR